MSAQRPSRTLNCVRRIRAQLAVVGARLETRLRECFGPWLRNTHPATVTMAKAQSTTANRGCSTLEATAVAPRPTRPCCRLREAELERRAGGLARKGSLVDPTAVVTLSADTSKVKRALVESAPKGPTEANPGALARKVLKAGGITTETAGGHSEAHREGTRGIRDRRAPQDDHRDPR